MIARRLKDNLAVAPEHLTRFAPVALTAESAFVRDLFYEIVLGSSSNGFEARSITWADLAAWQQVTGTVLSEWMRRLLMIVNAIYRTRMAEAERKERDARAPPRAGR